MNKKGFTLLELLAVIVVLAVIALIVTPFVTKAIEEAKRKSFENSAYGIMDAADLFYGTKMVKNDFSDTILSLTNGVDNNTPTFKYKGKKVENAYIEINDKGKIRMYVYDDGFCAKKETTSQKLTISKVAKADCSLDTLRQPVLAGGSSDWTISRTINVSNLPESDLELDYYEYYVSTSSNSLVGGEWVRAEGTSIDITE